MTILNINNLSYDYITRAGVTHALNDVSITFECGKSYAVTGRSGSGKTTLLSLIAAFDKPLGGSILYNGKNLKDINISKYRSNDVGIIFQSYNLIPQLTALENIMLVLEKNKMKNKKKYVLEILNKVGLTEFHSKKYPVHLSGGEQQRVAIARVLAANPNIILADEPTGNLDNENSKNIVNILNDIAHNENKCVIIVTHSEEIAQSVDVRYIMNNGTIYSNPV